VLTSSSVCFTALLMYFIEVATQYGTSAPNIEKLADYS
jgi:hypothetical protein